RMGTAPDIDFPLPAFGTTGRIATATGDTRLPDDEPVLDDTDSGDIDSGRAGFDDARRDAAPLSLPDLLTSARRLAARARGCEGRSRAALCAAVGCAHDFSLAADASPEEFARLVAEAGLTVQDRAPLTPIVKLVFGADYDKTRLTEYAAVLGHARRLGLG